MRLLTFIISSAILISCGPNPEGKTFSGELILTPAESALLCFDRMAELKEASKDKKNLEAIFKEFGIYNNMTDLAIKIPASKVEVLKAFIDQNQSSLIFNSNNEFLWKLDSLNSYLFLKNDRKSIDIGSLVLSVKKKKNTLEIQFSPKGKKVISGFSMKHLNRPILLEINGELITSVRSFGKMEKNTLIVKIK
jgi:hypothetical protein